MVAFLCQSGDAAAAAVASRGGSAAAVRRKAPALATASSSSSSSHRPRSAGCSPRCGFGGLAATAAVSVTALLLRPAEVAQSQAFGSLKAKAAASAASQAQAEMIPEWRAADREARKPEEEEDQQKCPMVSLSGDLILYPEYATLWGQNGKWTSKPSMVSLGSWRQNFFAQALTKVNFWDADGRTAVKAQEMTEDELTQSFGWKAIALRLLRPTSRISMGALATMALTTVIPFLADPGVWAKVLREEGNATRAEEAQASRCFFILKQFFSQVAPSRPLAVGIEDLPQWGFAVSYYIVEKMVNMRIFAPNVTVPLLRCITADFTYPMRLYQEGILEWLASDTSTAAMTRADSKFRICWGHLAIAMSTVDGMQRVGRVLAREFVGLMSPSQASGVRSGSTRCASTRMAWGRPPALRWPKQELFLGGHRLREAVALRLFRPVGKFSIMVFATTALTTVMPFMADPCDTAKDRREGSSSEALRAVVQSTMTGLACASPWTAC